jgi:hypothetical protein
MHGVLWFLWAYLVGCWVLLVIFIAGGCDIGPRKPRPSASDTKLGEGGP